MGKVRGGVGAGRNSISRGGRGEKAGRANVQGPLEHLGLVPSSSLAPAMCGPRDLEQDLTSLNLFPRHRRCLINIC